MNHRRRFDAHGAVLCAGDIMRRNPLSISESATIRETAHFLTAKNIGAAPVINEAGRPLGVLSRSDIVRKSRIREDDHPNLSRIPVRDIMTPYLFLVAERTPVVTVIEKLLDHAVRRVFVADVDGVLVGVVNATDILTKLRQSPLANLIPPTADSRTETKL